MVQSWPEDKKSIIMSQPISSKKTFPREAWDERHANHWGKNEQREPARLD